MIWQSNQNDVVLVSLRLETKDKIQNYVVLIVWSIDIIFKIYQLNRTYYMIWFGFNVELHQIEPCTPLLLFATPYKSISFAIFVENSCILGQLSLYHSKKLTISNFLWEIIC